MNSSQSKPVILKQININTSPNGYADVNGTMINNFTYTRVPNSQPKVQQQTHKIISENSKGTSNPQYRYTRNSGSTVNVNHAIGGAANVTGGVYNFTRK